MRKQKFRPRITRVRLYPEQAVLACSCWNGIASTGPAGYTFAVGCMQLVGKWASSYLCGVSGPSAIS